MKLGFLLRNSIFRSLLPILITETATLPSNPFGNLINPDEVDTGFLTLVGKTAVAGSNAQTLDSVALDLDTDKYYHFKATFRTLNTSKISLCCNDDVTPTNYDSHKIALSSSSEVVELTNTAEITRSDCATAYYTLVGDIKLGTNGKTYANYILTSSLGTIYQWRGTVSWRTTGTNVVKLKISSSDASDLEIGASFTVWKITGS